MPQVTVTVEIRNDRVDGHDDDRKDNRVLVNEQNRREVTLSRELDGIEDAVWALEAKEHEVIHDLWGEVKDDPEFEEWGFYSPYPSGDVSVSLDYTVSWHDVIHHVAARDGVDPLAVYMSPPGFWSRCRDTNDAMDGHRHSKRLLSAYLAYLGHDTSDWTHGHKPDRNRRSLRRVVEAVQMAGRNGDDN